MRLLSVNVSQPIKVAHEGKTIETGIFKQPVEGPVSVTASNLAGDRQADSKHHGGEDKAVYAYSYGHYAYWRDVLAREDLPYGQFGENLTISELDETRLHIGDRLQIGTAVFAITQPRVPCFKLGIRLANKEMPKLLASSGRTGFYLKVLREGTVEAGDTAEVVHREADGVSVRTLFQAYFDRKDGAAKEVLRQALRSSELSSEWRRNIEQRL